MPDLSTLEALIGRLAEKDFAGANEPATCEIAVLPVIEALGWDTDDFDEVRRQYPVKDIDGKEGSVDYCLYAKGGPCVLIEAKRAEEELSKHPRHQAQLLQYAYREGVELAALTNGLDWWLYLPMVGGEQADRRRFSRVNLREQTYSGSAAMLRRFLNRDCVVSGEAKGEAEREFEDQKRNRLVELAVPEAWRHVDGDSRLQGLLAEFARTVHERSGHRPGQETVARFLQSKLADIGEDKIPAAQPKTEIVVPHGGVKPDSGSEKPASKTPQPGPAKKRPSIPIEAFWLDGERHEVTRWSLLPARLCEVLARNAGPEFAERIVEMRGRRRPHFTRSANELRMPLEISGTRLYVEGNISAEFAERMARRVLRAIRGSDAGFRIERAEPPQDP
ncbi:MAG: type I restriction endonuclease [Alphaproteobacteria bacterium]|nr:type I restriction endonuclease [Alphaproteobacteria bacterium]